MIVVVLSIVISVRIAIELIFNVLCKYFKLNLSSGWHDAYPKAISDLTISLSLSLAISIDISDKTTEK